MEKKHDGSKICVKRVEDLLSEAEKKSEGERNKAHWTKIKKFVPKLLHNETKVYFTLEILLSEAPPILVLFLTSYILPEIQINTNHHV